MVKVCGSSKDAPWLQRHARHLFMTGINTQPSAAVTGQRYHSVPASLKQVLALASAQTHLPDLADLD
jgi:hypothetical protein